MSIKPTVIGGKPTPETGSKPAPTRLGNPDAEGAASAQPSPVAPSPVARPTGFKPTAMPGAQPPKEPAPATVPTSVARPTAMPSRAPAAAPVPAQPMRASALPGTQRKPLDVSYAELVARFPGTDAKVLEQARALLAGVSPHTTAATAWLNFGVPAQEGLSELVKERVALMDTSPARSVSQHLARLLHLLRDVLDAMDGGFFKKPAAAVWEAHAGEVRQLEALLTGASPDLATMLGALSALTAKNQAASETLHANSLAAEYLVDLVGGEAGHLLVSRATALTSSMGLALEQIQMLTQDATQVQELTTLVQNGVLLQLPAVYSQMAGLSTKPSDTQRYLATEKLNDIVNFIQRKL
jgi:hypothetical protein